MDIFDWIALVVIVLVVIFGVHFVTLPNEPIRTDEDENP